MIEKLTLDSYQGEKFVRNLLIFLIPTAILYIGQLAVTFQDPVNVIEFADLLPSSVTIGGILQYILSALIDYRKKLQDSGNSF